MLLPELYNRSPRRKTFLVVAMRRGQQSERKPSCCEDAKPYFNMQTLF